MYYVRNRVVPPKKPSNRVLNFALKYKTNRNELINMKPTSNRYPFICMLSILELLKGKLEV